MNRANVTLLQILSAATARAAVMVPESAGFLVLSLCEATGHLPVRIVDSSVLILPEGAVMTTQQGEVLRGPEAAKQVRELLARLLAVASGSAPRLFAVARPRPLSVERSVDAVASEIEAALVPLNRAAAKRTLARLARETARAVDAGLVHVRPAVVSPPSIKEPAPAAISAPAPLPTAIPAPAPAPAPAPLPAAVSAPLPAPVPVPVPVSTPAPASVRAPRPAAPSAPSPLPEVLATPTQIDSFSAAVHITSSSPSAIFDLDRTPVGEPSHSPGLVRSSVDPDPTLLSARDVRIEQSLDDKHPHVSITGAGAVQPYREREITLVSGMVEPVSAPPSSVSADSLLPSAPAISQQTDPSQKLPFAKSPSAPQAEARPVSRRERKLIEHTLPWPVGLGMPVRTPLPIAAHAVLVEEVQTPSPPVPSALTPSALPPSSLALSSLSPSAEELHSSEYEVCSPAASPPVVPVEPPLTPSNGFSDLIAEHADLSPAAPASALSRSPLPAVSATPPQAVDEPEPIALVKKPKGPDRVDELLSQFARPEGGEEQMLRQTASSLKELAGLPLTPYAPPIEPLVRIPERRENAKSPAWVAEAPRDPAVLKPAPLVAPAKRHRAWIVAPLLLVLLAIATTSVLAWKRPDLLTRVAGRPLPWLAPSAESKTNAPDAPAPERVVSVDDPE